MPNLPGGPINTGSEFLYETPNLLLPQTTFKTLFTFSGLQYLGAPGWVILVNLAGQVTTAVGAVANATKLQLVSTKDDGTALSAVDLCATLDINGKALGVIFGITGTVTDAMTTNANGVLAAQVTPLQVGFGTTCTLRVNCAGSDGGVGTVKWALSAKASYGVQITPAFS